MRLLNVIVHRMIATKPSYQTFLILIKESIVMCLCEVKKNVALKWRHRSRNQSEEAE
jgi:hypothetical protein